MLALLTQIFKKPRLPEVYGEDGGYADGMVIGITMGLKEAARIARHEAQDPLKMFQTGRDALENMANHLDVLASGVREMAFPERQSG